MIKRIVLTGGPCGGKTSAIKIMRKYYTKKGYTVLSIDESATNIISKGISPYNSGLSMYEFQKYVFDYQLKEEEKIEKYIKENKNKKIIVFYDRCLLDNKSYVTDEEFNKLLKEYNLDINKYIKKFDIFIHMVSAAIGTNEYTLDTNDARVETKQEAKKKDDKIRECYKNIDNYVIVDNSSNFEDKVNRVIQIVDNK